MKDSIGAALVGIGFFVWVAMVIYRMYLVIR